MTKKKIPVKKYIAAALALCLLYIVSTAVLPAMLRKPISQDFAASVSVSDYYGSEECVDRVALVESPSQGFASRLHILDEATERIDVSYYAIHIGQTADLFFGGPAGCC